MQGNGYFEGIANKGEQSKKSGMIENLIKKRNEKKINEIQLN